ncbi:hypothetical protein BpHYR1_025939 [Brachionus plicatilis]|uniref:Uncharacterized protein n=1 Tax=Brachionus plicatilis TaxID=10195 RepID=A0A3M7SMB7_BRAPC|nr:hypothetical protein BpHYR1_025939 [Brachionus plicatilis]
MENCNICFYKENKRKKLIIFIIIIGFAHELYKPWAYMYFRGWAYIIEKWGAYRLILIFSPGLVCQAFLEHTEVHNHDHNINYFFKN